MKIENLNGVWLLNGKTYAACDTDEKEFFNSFFKYAKGRQRRSVYPYPTPETVVVNNLISTYGSCRIGSQPVPKRPCVQIII